MHEISTQEIGYYAAVWAVAFAVALCRCSREIRDIGLVNVLSACGLAGFLSFGIVAILVDRDGSSPDIRGHNSWYYLAISVLVGIAAKNPEKIAWQLLNRILDASRALLVNKEDQDDSEK